MTEKLIIRNKTDLAMSVVTQAVNMVVKQGRISDDGKSYCYVMTFNSNGKEYAAQAKRNEDSDTITIVDSHIVDQEPDTKDVVNTESE